MNRTQRLIIIPALILLATPLFATSFHPVRATSTPFIDPDLASQIDSGTSPLEFVVTYDHYPTSSDRAYLTNIGTKAVFMDRLPMALAIGTPSQALAIAQQPGVRSLWNNTPQAYYGQVKTTTHSYGSIPVSNSWWIDTMNVRPAWKKGIQGQGIGVAIVDSGVDATNPSLGYNFPDGQSFASKRVIQNVKVLAASELLLEPPLGPDELYVENQPSTDTTGGHGTGTSSSAAGTGLASDGVYMGVAPQADIIGLGSGDTIAIFYVIASFDYILKHQNDYHIRVNSNSWGPASDCESCFSPDDPINVATKQMHDAGITVLFSAGNSGPGDGSIGGYAVQPWVIGVAATQISKGLTTFSSRGLSTDPSRWPTVAAPGENVIASKALTGFTDNSLNAPQDSGNIIPAYQNYYTTFGGTSAASPLTAGAAALVLSANPSLNPDQVKNIIAATADPMPGYLTYQQGAGHVNAARAVQFAQTGSFQPGKIEVENRGIQAFNLQAFEAFGLEVPLASTPVDNNFPTFAGAQYFNVTVSWQNPSGDHGWNVRLYSPNDKSLLRTPLPGNVVGLNGVYSTLGSTSISFSVSDASTISSYYQPGQTMGTWDVEVINTQSAEPYHVSVSVTYSQPGKMSMADSHSITTEDNGVPSQSGNLQAIFQGYDGAVQGTLSLGTATAGQALSIATTLVQPQGQVVQVVQLVLKDASGNTVEWLDAWVTTQADLQSRIAQVQSALLTATPTQTAQLQAELAQLNAAITTASTTETLP